MAEFKLAPGGGGGGDGKDGFDALSGLGDGLLGTGYSTSIEIAFVVIGLIVVGIVFNTVRYIVAEKDREDDFPEEAKLPSE